MNAVEAISLLCVFAIAAFAWMRFFILPSQPLADGEASVQAAPRPASDVEKDTELVRGGVNLMNAAQLSEAQTADNAPHQICVFAPDPLELHAEEVYQSTLEWVKRHIGAVETLAETPNNNLDGPLMVFWCRRSEAVPRVLEIVSRLHADLQGDSRLFDLVECVRAPDYLFFVDMTLHRFRNHQIRAYINARENGVTNLLVELPGSHATHIDAVLGQWLRAADLHTLHFQAAGAGVRRSQQPEKNRDLSIRCWDIGQAHLEMKPALEAVQEMFLERPAAPALRVISSTGD